MYDFHFASQITVKYRAVHVCLAGTENIAATPVARRISFWSESYFSLICSLLSHRNLGCCQNNGYIHHGWAHDFEQRGSMVEQAGREAYEDKAAIAEAAGDVAANLAALDRAPLAGNTSQNQLLRACFDGLGAPANDSCQVQQTAAAALAQVSAAVVALPMTHSHVNR